MGRVVGDERLAAAGGGVVARGGERGVQRERVAAGRLAQRGAARAAQAPAGGARQPPRQALHHARVEEVEHARCNITYIHSYYYPPSEYSL